VGAGGAASDDWGADADPPGFDTPSLEEESWARREMQAVKRKTTGTLKRSLCIKEPVGSDPMLTER
jgi:hypothetical protein